MRSFLIASVVLVACGGKLAGEPDAGEDAGSDAVTVLPPATNPCPSSPIDCNVGDTCLLDDLCGASSTCTCLGNSSGGAWVCPTSRCPACASFPAACTPGQECAIVPMCGSEGYAGISVCIGSGATGPIFPCLPSCGGGIAQGAACSAEGQLCEGGATSCNGIPIPLACTCTSGAWSCVPSLTCGV